jgi:hypothetical protein
MVLKKFGQKVELSQKLTPLESPVIHYAKSKAKLEKKFHFISMISIIIQPSCSD